MSQGHLSENQLVNLNQKDVNAANICKLWNYASQQKRLWEGNKMRQKKSKPQVWWNMRSWRMWLQGHTQSKKIDIKLGHSRNLVIPCRPRRTPFKSTWRRRKHGGLNNLPALLTPSRKLPSWWASHNPSCRRELRCQQSRQSAHRGDYHDVRTSSHTTSEAQAQSPSTTPSIDPFEDSGPVRFDSVHHGQHSFSLPSGLHKPVWCFCPWCMAWIPMSNWRQFWKDVQISTIFGAPLWSHMSSFRRISSFPVVCI